MIARGLGRSYGDAAQCAGGLVVDCTGLDRITGLDVAGATLQAESGVSMESLLRLLVPRGLFPPVTPGTRFVTLGGAIASDVHGKNHHVDGALSRHLTSVRVATPGGPIECGPGQNDDIFAATCGGMGLTGIILDAVLQLIRIETSSMLVNTERAADLDSCMARLSEDQDCYRYSVAWVDALSGGRSLGRAVITRANHALVTQLPPSARHDPFRLHLRRPVRIPMTPPVSLLNPATVAAFNEMWFRRAPRRRSNELVPLARFSIRSTASRDGISSMDRGGSPSTSASFPSVQRRRWPRFSSASAKPVRPLSSRSSNASGPKGRGSSRFRERVGPSPWTSPSDQPGPP